MDVTKLLSDAVSFMKASISQMKNSELSEEEKESVSSFIQSLKDEILGKQPSGIEILDKYTSDPGDLLLEGKLIRSIELAIISEESQQSLSNMIDKLQHATEEISKNLETADYEIEEDESIQLPSLPSDSIIMVPWDFSQVAEYALEHALVYAKKINGRIILLHIIKKEKERGASLEKLQVVIDQTFSKHKIKPEALIREGSIFNEITTVSNELNADLLIMGTHGIKGMQKLTGSNALKVISDTKAPFIVVQAPPAKDSVKNILFPIDYRREIRQKLNQARYLSHYFNAKFHLCYPTDITFDTTKQKTMANLKFIEKYFIAHNLDYETHGAEGTSDFGEATIKMAGELIPDLIMILITKDINFANFILGAEEQKIITNQFKLPVMCINPVHGKWSFFTR